MVVANALANCPFDKRNIWESKRVRAHSQKSIHVHTTGPQRKNAISNFKIQHAINLFHITSHYQNCLSRLVVKWMQIICILHIAIGRLKNVVVSYRIQNSHSDTYHLLLADLNLGNFSSLNFFSHSLTSKSTNQQIWTCHALSPTLFHGIHETPILSTLFGRALIHVPSATRDG